MNYELFIAKRIIAGKKYKSNISSPIIKIAVLAIVLGISIMLISVSVATGFENKIRDKISSFKGHLQITNNNMNTSDVSIQPISMDQDFYPDFKGVKYIKNVQVFANKAGIIRTDKSFEGIVLKGVDAHYDFDAFKNYIVEGRLPNFKAERNREILISKAIANRLNIKLGDTIQALFNAPKTRNKFKMRKPIVVGVYDSGFLQFDKLMLIGDIREIQHLNKWDQNQVGGFEVVLDDFDKIDEVGALVSDSISPMLESLTIKDNYPEIFAWLNLVSNNVWVIISFVLLIALINITTALLVLILERTQFIGILKALGGTNWSIQKIFLFNASYLVFKGMLIGNIVGLGLLLIQKYGKFLRLDPESYYISYVPVDFDITTMVILNVTTFILCFVVLIIPSIIITKIIPTKAIKFE